MRNRAYTSGKAMLRRAAVPSCREADASSGAKRLTRRCPEGEDSLRLPPAAALCCLQGRQSMMMASTCELHMQSLKRRPHDNLRPLGAAVLERKSTLALSMRQARLTKLSPRAISSGTLNPKPYRLRQGKCGPGVRRLRLRRKASKGGAAALKCAQVQRVPPRRRRQALQRTAS